MRSILGAVRRAFGSGTAAARVDRRRQRRIRSAMLAEHLGSTRSGTPRQPHGPGGH